MEVIKMAEYRARETVALLTVLLERAKRGDVDGIAVCLHTAKGAEEMAFTDRYRREPAMAANGAMRLCWRLTQFQDEQDAARM